MSTTEKFITDHQAEIDEALAYARKGRECAELREFCADQIERIYDDLEALYVKQEAE